MPIYEIISEHILRMLLVLVSEYSWNFQYDAGQRERICIGKVHVPLFEKAVVKFWRVLREGGYILLHTSLRYFWSIHTLLQTWYTIFAKQGKNFLSIMNIQQVFCDKLNEIISTNYSLYLLRIFVSVKNKSCDQCWK